MKLRLSLVADGNTGTGPGDPWTGGGGGVQPPYSGYAPSHLAQPAYPMHLPHDPMVSDFFYLSLSFSSFLSFLSPTIPLPNPKKRSITRDSAVGSYGAAVARRRLWNLVIDTGIFLLSRILCRRTREFDEEVDRLKPKRAT